MSKISMRKISEILRQRHELKRSYRDIGQSLNISPSTVGLYLCLAKTAGISWPLPSDKNDEELYEYIFKSKALKEEDTSTAPDFEKVHQEYRKKGVTLRLLWQEYREIYPDGLSYSQYCDRFRSYKKKIEPVMRQMHKAGEKTFVDYAGLTMDWIDPTTGEINCAQIFVGAMGASQYIYCEATATQGLADWISSHINMFEYFGGVSEIVVPDNLKSAVTTAHRYDPDINVNYQHFSQHYGFAIIPARVREPKDKAKVENAVGLITRQILASLRNITFTSIAEISIAIKKKLSILNHQSFQKMQSSRYELFNTIDKPALKPLPPDRYQYSEWSYAKINIDYHFIFDKHFYSAPYQYLKCDVEIRSTNKTIECFCSGKRIAVHVRKNQNHQFKYSTLKEHMPPAHRAQAEWGPERMKRWAKKIGPKTSEFIEVMIKVRHFKEQAYRGCLGVLRLGDRYGAARLEKASEIALVNGATRYKQIETILKNKMDTVVDLQSEQITSTTLDHENIRGAGYYQ